MSTAPPDDTRFDHWEGSPRSTYRLTRALGLRALGPVCMVLGVVWAITGFTGFAAWLVWVLVAFSLLFMLAVVRLVAWPPVLVRLDEDGFEIRPVRGGTGSSGRWDDVVSVGAAELRGSPCLVVQTSEDAASVVPLPLVGESSTALQNEVRQRLNAAHGYRRLG